MVTAYGFKTGDVWLPGLDLTISLDSDRFLRNDGFVEDVIAHANQVYREMGLDTDFHNEEEIFASGRHLGFDVQIQGHHGKASVIFVGNMGDVYTVFCLGHESTHALQFLGAEKYLVDDLKTHGFSMNPFARYTDREDIANVGGCLSLYKADILDRFANSDVAKIKEEFLCSRL
jgi:hypothetical protein